MEIWKDNSIQYLAIELQGNILPSQTIMEDRDTMLELVSNNYLEYEFLDLVGVGMDGQTIWNDNLHRGEQ
jgi:methyl coenzyme M reductase gamma subunit